ncbi:rod shape-determining protein MreD [Spirochaetia bacterium]|nr:rod shape-determining protein MreD [Spirochaetia bacterium]GHU35699.1 rod shape-determining protein MreD [Spirochaetia bacterium]
MAKNVFSAVLFAFAGALIQSTILFRITPYNAVPDLVLIVIVFSAFYNGSLTGQLTGFFSGILLDLLSASPLGLNALVFVIIGALVGLLHEALSINNLFFGALICTTATLFKVIFYIGLHQIFTQSIPAYIFGDPTFFTELISNTILAPVVFFLLKKFKSILIDQTTERL